MSTRSMIGRKNPDGTVTSIYCHHDGYPEYVGNMLLQYYNSTERCNALLCLGDISSLYPALGDADDPALVKLGVTKAYSRDRGEELNFHTYNTETEFLEKAWKDSDAEWINVCRMCHRYTRSPCRVSDIEQESELLGHLNG